MSCQFCTRPHPVPPVLRVPSVAGQVRMYRYMALVWSAGEQGGAWIRGGGFWLGGCSLVAHSSPVVLTPQSSINEHRCHPHGMNGARQKGKPLPSTIDCVPPHHWPPWTVLPLPPIPRPERPRAAPCACSGAEFLATTRTTSPRLSPPV